MKNLKRRDLLKNNTGSTAIIFAMVAAAILVMGASAVEMSRVTNVKNKLNAITDAAALAGKRAQNGVVGQTLSAAQAIATTEAQKSFAANKHQLNGIANNVSLNVTFDGDGALRATGHADALLIFGQVFGLDGSAISYVPTTAVAVAAAGNSAFLEVALVLDNTGSMFEYDGRATTRFTLLRNAAKSFVNASFTGTVSPGSLRIGVVPFASTVNIKGETPLGWDVSSLNNTVADYGSRQLITSPMNRSGYLNDSAGTLTTKFAPVGWRGCISGAGESSSASDAANPTMKWDALAVPNFPHMFTWYPTRHVTQTCESCPPPPGPPPGPPPPPPPPGPPPPPPPPPPPCNNGKGNGNGKGRCMDGNYVPKNKARAQFAEVTKAQKLAANTFVPPNLPLTPINRPLNGTPKVSFTQIKKVQSPGCTFYDCSYDECNPTATPTTMVGCGQNTQKHYGPAPYDFGRRNTFTQISGTCVNTWSCTPAPMPTLVANPCVADPNEVAWNAGGGAWCSWVDYTDWTSFEPTVGPNINCPTPMLGLSGSRPQVLATLDRMTPVVGGTHNDVGLMWGLRMLAPRTQWANFFGLTTPAAPYIGSNTKKAMVLITDGENTQANDFPGYWGCADTVAPGCTGSPDQAALNTKMLDWCTEIRDNNIELYTVAVNVTDTSAVNLLAQCAGDTANAFNIDAAELQTTLASISSQIFDIYLRE